MLEVIPSWIVTAEVNDGPVTLRCARDDVDVLVRIMRYNNAKWVKAELERVEDWQQWPRLGNVAWDNAR